MRIKISIVLFISFFHLLNVYADDAFIRCFGGGAGNVRSTEQYYELGQEKDIVMTSEHVLITMYDEYYTVDAKFWFKNEGNEKTISIGFPENNLERFDKREEFFKVILTVNVVPTPFSESTTMLPFIISTIFLVMAIPKPVLPNLFVEVELS